MFLMTLFLVLTLFLAFSHLFSLLISFFLILTIRLFFSLFFSFFLICLSVFFLVRIVLLVELLLSCSSRSCPFNPRVLRHKTSTFIILHPANLDRTHMM